MDEFSKIIPPALAELGKMKDMNPNLFIVCVTIVVVVALIVTPWIIKFLRNK